jgi:hypothetical protein
VEEERLGICLGKSTSRHPNIPPGRETGQAQSKFQRNWRGSDFKGLQLGGVREENKRAIHNL